MPPRTSRTQIKSEQELGNLIYDAMKNAVEYTMVKLFQENEELIQKYVYSAYSPEYYQRTGEFLDAWNYKVKKTSDHHNISYTSSRVHSEFYYDPGVMHYNPSQAQHGTPVRDELYYRQPSPETWAKVEGAWGDAREYLADILYEGKGGPLFGNGPWRKKRDAWTPLLKTLDRGKIFRWFEEGMQNQKLKLDKGR